MQVLWLSFSGMTPIYHLLQCVHNTLLWSLPYTGTGLESWLRLAQVWLNWVVHCTVHFTVHLTVHTEMYKGNRLHCQSLRKYYEIYLIYDFTKQCCRNTMTYQNCKHHKNTICILVMFTNWGFEDSKRLFKNIVNISPPTKQRPSYYYILDFIEKGNNINISLFINTY